MFFHKICKVICNHCFIIISNRNKVFVFVLIYFKIIKTNDKNKLYLYYLIKLKSMINLSKF